MTPSGTFGNALVTGKSSGEKRLAQAVRIGSQWAAQVTDGHKRTISLSVERWKSKELALQVAIRTARTL